MSLSVLADVLKLCFVMYSLVVVTSLSDVSDDAVPLGTFFSIVKRLFTFTSSDTKFISGLIISMGLIEKAETLFVDKFSSMKSLYEF